MLPLQCCQFRWTVSRLHKQIAISHHRVSQSFIALLSSPLAGFFAERQSPCFSRMVRRQLRPCRSTMRPVPLSPRWILPRPPLQFVRSRPLLRCELFMSAFMPTLPLSLQMLRPPLRVGLQFFIPPLTAFLLHTHAPSFPRHSFLLSRHFFGAVLIGLRFITDPPGLRRLRPSTSRCRRRTRSSACF